jgi:hypothetical protein
MSYRLSRNLEASLVQWLEEGLAEDWANWTIRVVKAFTQAHDGTLPAICVNFVTANPTQLEIGSSTWLKNPEVSFRLFCRNDGERLDLASWLLDKLEESIDYYEYTITDGEISQQTLVGKIVVGEILKDIKELTNTENLVQTDKFRHNITFRCRVATT